MTDMVTLQRWLKEAQQEKKTGTQVWFIHGFRVTVTWKEAIDRHSCLKNRLTYQTSWYVNGGKVSARSLQRIVFGQRLS